MTVKKAGHAAIHYLNNCYFCDFCMYAGLPMLPRCPIEKQPRTVFDLGLSLMAYVPHGSTNQSKQVIAYKTSRPNKGKIN